MELKLDGNAVAGELREIFGVEMTTVRGTCGNCGAVAPLGAVSVYLHAPGIVLRCSYCDNVLLRIVKSPAGRIWIEASGIRSLELRLEP